MLALLNGADPVPMRTTTRFPAVKGADWLLELARTDAAKSRERRPEWVLIEGNWNLAFCSVLETEDRPRGREVVLNKSNIEGTS